MHFIEIAGQRFPVELPLLHAYDCEAPVATWVLAFDFEYQGLGLMGRISPGPRTAADFVGARIQLDSRVLSQVAGKLLGRPVMLHPRDDDGRAQVFHFERGNIGVALRGRCLCDWVRSLETFPTEGPVELVVELDAVVGALRPGELPD